MNTPVSGCRCTLTHLSHPLESAACMCMDMTTCRGHAELGKVWKCLGVAYLTPVHIRVTSIAVQPRSCISQLPDDYMSVGAHLPDL